MVHIADLRHDPQNARKHNPRNIGMIADSLQQFGPARSITIDEANKVLAGNGVVEAAAQIGVEYVRVFDRASGVLEPEPPGPHIFAVRVSGLTPEQKKLYAIADNRTTDLSEFIPEVLQVFLDEGLDLEQFWFPEELDVLLAGGGDDDSFLDDALGAGDGKSPWPGDGPESDPNTMTFKVTPEERDIIMGAVRIARSSDVSLDSTPAAIVAICEDYRCQHAS